MSGQDISSRQHVVEQSSRVLCVHHPNCRYTIRTQSRTQEAPTVLWMRSAHTRQSVARCPGHDPAGGYRSPEIVAQKSASAIRTQKPQALLERIISGLVGTRATSYLDPFCGCGYRGGGRGEAEAAVDRHEDVTHLAVALMKNRLRTAFDIVPGKDYEVVGEPVDVGSARALAEQDRYQFQFWAMSLLGALPRESGKRGADRGIDGLVYFIDGPRGGMKKTVVQVKSGKVSSPLIRDLKGTVEREKAALGLFITLEEPTGAMRTEAVSAGFYHSDLWQRDYPKIQIRTVGELLDGKVFELPQHPSMYQAAERVWRSEAQQTSLDEALGA